MDTSAVRLMLATAASLVLTSSPAQDVQNGSHVSLGVVVQPAGLCSAATQLAAGALIQSVRPGGSADRAGLKAGDLVIRFGGTEIRLWTDLPHAVQQMHVGDQVDVIVQRGGDQRSQHLQFSQTDVYAPVPATVSGPSPPQSAGPATVPSTSCPPQVYQVLPLPADAAQRAAGLNGDSAVSLDGDVLTIAHRDAGEAVQLSGSLQLPMTRVPGTQVWLTQLKMDGWDRMFFSYEFIGGRPSSATPQLGTFHGSKAPALPLSALRLKGRLIHTHLHSGALSADRDVDVYLPPEARGKGDRDVLYMTDGQSVEAFARVLEPLILSHQIQPIAIIGELSAQSNVPAAVSRPQTDTRTREYVPGVDKDLFDRHLRFFTEELLPWASHTYAVSARRSGRALFGFSNGADFAIEMAVEHPELFEAVLPFSAGAPMIKAIPTVGMPRLYLAAGELEPAFATVTRQVQGMLQAAGADATFTAYPSGHDILMWETALVKYIPLVFPTGGRSAVNGAAR